MKKKLLHCGTLCSMLHHQNKIRIFLHTTHNHTERSVIFVWYRAGLAKRCNVAISKWAEEWFSQCTASGTLSTADIVVWVVWTSIFHIEYFVFSFFSFKSTDVLQICYKLPSYYNNGLQELFIMGVLNNVLYRSKLYSNTHFYFHNWLILLLNKRIIN